MSTMILEVNTEQEKVLENLLKYMNVSFQKVNNQEDFWDSLSPQTQKQIEKGLADTDSGRYSPAKNFIEDLLKK